MDNITYWSDVQDGTHCATRAEWRTPLQQNIQKFLLTDGQRTGDVPDLSRKAGNLAEWRDWQTPILSDGPTTPPTTPAHEPTTHHAPPTTPPPTDRRPRAHRPSVPRRAVAAARPRCR